MINLIQFSPCGAIIVCVLAWIRIVMLSHKMDQLEKTISKSILRLRADVDNQSSKICIISQQLNTKDHI